MTREECAYLRKEARAMDEELKKLNATGGGLEGLDPEVQEQMRQFALMEQMEREAMLGQSFGKTMALDHSA